MWGILRKSYREAVSYIPLIPQNPSNVRYIEIIARAAKLQVSSFCGARKLGHRITRIRLPPHNMWDARPSTQSAAWGLTGLIRYPFLSHVRAR